MLDKEIFTYQTQIKKDFLYGLDMLAWATNDLSLQISLENLGYERLNLHFVLDVQMVAKTWLNQILEKNYEKFLSVTLFAYLELIRNLVDEDYYW